MRARVCVGWGWGGSGVQRGKNGGGRDRRYGNPRHPMDLYMEVGTNPKIIIEREKWVRELGYSVKEFHRRCPKASTRLCTPLVRSGVAGDVWDA